MSVLKLTKAQLADLARLSRYGSGPARTGAKLARMGLVASVGGTGIHRGPTVWRTTIAGEQALELYRSL